MFRMFLYYYDQNYDDYKHYGHYSCKYCDKHYDNYPCEHYDHIDNYDCCNDYEPFWGEMLERGQPIPHERQRCD
jgi:hypothetical protein